MRIQSASIIFAAVFLSASIASSAQAGVEADMEIAVDRMYGDYANYDLPSGDPAECRAACDRDAQCIAWSFVKPGVQANVARCWLKNQTPQPAASKCCISGVKKR